MADQQSIINEFDQPIGPPLDEWQRPAYPGDRIEGSGVVLEALTRDAHAVALFAALADAPESIWTYMPFGPFDDAHSLGQLFDVLEADPDFRPYAVVVDAIPLGFLSFMRIEQGAGAIEIGAIVFSPAMQRTRASTETLYLMIDHAFGLGYRRVEWKCDALHAKSRQAAARYGFIFEGVFRKATNYKGRSRDTAWHAIIDDDWPRLRNGFKQWLAPSNFDDNGLQRTPLSDHF